MPPQILICGSASQGPALTAAIAQIAAMSECSVDDIKVTTDLSPDKLEEMLASLQEKPMGNVFVIKPAPQVDLNLAAQIKTLKMVKDDHEEALRHLPKSERSGRVPFYKSLRKRRK